MDPSRIPATLFLLALLGCCYGDGYKRWVPNTNFETAANWEGGNVPCANDHVKFPDNLGAVFVQTNTTITEMVLPMTGELLLGNYISISFPLEPVYTPGCPIGREVSYTRTDPKSWFDPSDWCVTSTEAGDCQADQPALLASEQVPCNSDTVSFPMSSSFLVGLEYGTDIYAGALIISGKSYSTATFKAYLESEEGRRQFVRASGSPATTVTLTGNQCTDMSGCACGNDRGSILDKICQTSAGQCEETLTCTHTIKPMGACCEICGAVMKLDIGSGFNKKDTENMILSKYVHGQDKYKNVKPIVSKTSLGQIQVVITDGGDGVIAAEVAFALKEDFEGNANYGVTGVSVDVSGTVTPTPTGQTGQDPGSIAGIVIGLLLAIVIAIILYFVVGKRRRPTLPFNLNIDSVRSTVQNLGRPKPPADLELGTVSFRNSSDVDDLFYGFDNPMYGNAGPDAGAVKDVSETSPPAPVPTKLEPVSGTLAGFSNPIYGSGIQMDFENLGESESTSKKSPNASKPVEKLTFPDATAAGFSNPLYSTPIQAVDNRQALQTPESPVQDTAAGFANPLYSTPIQVVDQSQALQTPESPVQAATVDTAQARTVDSSDNAVLVLNPITDGVEDSFI